MVDRTYYPGTLSEGARPPPQARPSPLPKLSALPERAAARGPLRAQSEVRRARARTGRPPAGPRHPHAGGRTPRGGAALRHMMHPGRRAGHRAGVAGDAASRSMDQLSIHKILGYRRLSRRRREVDMRLWALGLALALGMGWAPAWGKPRPNYAPVSGPTYTVQNGTLAVNVAYGDWAGYFQNQLVLAEGGSEGLAPLWSFKLSPRTFKHVSVDGC